MGRLPRRAIQLKMLYKKKRVAKRDEYNEVSSPDSSLFSPSSSPLSQWSTTPRASLSPPPGPSSLSRTSTPTPFGSGDEEDNGESEVDEDEEDEDYKEDEDGKEDEDDGGKGVGGNADENVDENEMEETDDDEIDDEVDDDEIDEEVSDDSEDDDDEFHIAALNNYIKTTANIPLSALQLHHVSQYLVLRKNNHSTSEASNLIAESVNRGFYYARCLRKWGQDWIENRQVPPVKKQGRHTKVKSLLEETDVRLAVKAYLDENKFTASPKTLKNHLETEIFPKLTLSREVGMIHEDTVRRWMIKLGYVYSRRKKGIYVDGHERDDVKAYRERFLRQLTEMEPVMVDYDRNLQPLPHNIPLGQQHILVTHDEAVFNANDDLNFGWGPKGEQPLRKKSRGAGMMISEFLLDTIGRLAVPEKQYSEMEPPPPFPREACTLFQIGKHRDGYWTGEDLLKQITTKAIPIFEAVHPNCIAVFAFDSCRGHSMYAPDALLAHKMNLKPGGKQPLMRATTFNGTTQEMVFPLDHPDVTLRGKAKGLRAVLEERGLWPEKTILAKCKEACKANDCCAQRILSLQEDFMAQKPLIQETVESFGHKCVVYPKFHSELNYIEYFWKDVKRYCRINCNYTWAGLKENIPRALASVDLLTIRRYARRSQRYMDVYHKGLTLAAAEDAVKKYRSHRRIPEKAVQSVDV